MNKELLAKSANRLLTGKPPTVEEHCREVRWAAEALWEAIEPELADATVIERGELRRDLRPLFLAAALLHDIAKANSAFQALVQPGGKTKERQPIRHEILGAILLARGLLLADLAPADLWTLVWTVAGHHLKMSYASEADEKLFITGNTPREVTIYLSDKQVAVLLNEVASLLRNAGRTANVIPSLRDRRFETIDDSDKGLEAWVECFIRDSSKAWRAYSKDEAFQRRLALLKVLLISADIAGSALPENGQPIADWVRGSLAAQVNREILEPIVQDGHGGTPRKFQEDVAASNHSATVVIAGCGNGKTSAGYMWAQKWATGRKLFFTYPTTGTASAGFEDYILEQKHVTSALIHGRAVVDLQTMLGTKEDDRLDEWLRLESLQAWNRQVIVCTVDTVLGLIQNQRRSLFSFPAIAKGAFIFDEIHSYDRRLFGELLTFLKTFAGVPVLLMSASIPPNRLAALKEALGNRVGEVIAGDPQLERIKRYRLAPRDSVESCWKEVETALRIGKKVLWVCNTVSSAITLAEQARKRSLGVEPIIYHSRFRYKDRVRRQKEVIDEFAYEEMEARRHVRRKPEPALVIATQVCEMSLDISADLMVTAECPLPSLVQRLGRLNRYAVTDDAWTCLVYPFKGDPYNEEMKHLDTKGDYRISMATMRAAVTELAGLPCSQADIADRLNGMNQAEQPDRSSAWLHGGWESRPLPAREGDTSITIIREEDLADIAHKIGPENPRVWTNRRLVPWTIPMLYDRRFNFERRVGGYPLAPTETIHYDEKEGATWQLSQKN